MLLYKSERQQYQGATADHVSPSTVYGAEHLLRLFGMLLFDIQKATLSWERCIAFSVGTAKYCCVLEKIGCCLCLRVCVCV